MGKSQNACFKKTKHIKFSEKLTENLMRFVFLKHPLCDSPDIDLEVFHANYNFSILGVPLLDGGLLSYFNKTAWISNKYSFNVKSTSLALSWSVPISSSSSIKLRVCWFKLSNKCLLLSREAYKLIGLILSFSRQSVKITFTEFISLDTALLSPCLVLVKLSILAIEINSYGKSKHLYSKEKNREIPKTIKPRQNYKPKIRNIYTYALDKFTQTHICFISFAFNYKSVQAIDV